MTNPRPHVSSPPPWSFPTPETARLDNGLNIVVFRRPGQYVVSATLVLELPLTAEGSREGIALITARSLDEGTPTFPGTAFAEAVEDQGAHISVDVTSASTQICLDVPGSRLDVALRLLAEMVRSPVLAADDVARQVNIRLAELEQLLANSSRRASLEFRRAVIDSSCRFARPPGGLADDVRNLQLDDVVAFHSDYYRPSGATLVMAGDFASDPLAAADAAFGDWTGASPLVTHPNVPAAPKCARLFDRPDAVQADVRLGKTTVCRTSDLWADLTVATYAMGGAFHSRLNRELRENRGFTYGVGMGITPFRDFGIGSVQGSFRPDSVADALALTEQLIDLDRQPFDADEVKHAVDFYTGVTPLRYAAASGIVDQVATLISMGLDASFVDQNLAALQRVTPRSATAAARDEFRLPPLSLVVVGPAATLAEPLRQAGWPIEVFDF